MHAEGATTVFAKSAKRTRKLTKYGFFGTFAPFSGDISMTSLGDVAVYEWSTGVVRWQTGVAMVDGARGRGDDAGSDAPLTLADRWRNIGPLMLRKGICQRGLRYDLGATRGPGLTSASDRYRTISFGRRGRSDIHVNRRMKSA